MFENMYFRRTIKEWRTGCACARYCSARGQWEEWVSIPFFLGGAEDGFQLIVLHVVEQEDIQESINMLHSSGQILPQNLHYLCEDCEGPR